MHGITVLRFKCCCIYTLLLEFAKIVADIHTLLCINRVFEKLKLLLTYTHDVS